MVSPPFDRIGIPITEGSDGDVGRVDLSKHFGSGGRSPKQRKGAAAHAMHAQMELNWGVIRETELGHHIGWDRNLHLHLARKPSGPRPRQVESVEARESAVGGSVARGRWMHYLNCGAERTVEATRGGVPDDRACAAVSAIRHERGIKVTCNDPEGLMFLCDTTVDASTGCLDILGTETIQIVNIDDPTNKFRQVNLCAEDTGTLCNRACGKAVRLTRVQTPPACLLIPGENAM